MANETIPSQKDKSETPDEIFKQLAILNAKLDTITEFLRTLGQYSEYGKVCSNGCRNQSHVSISNVSGMIGSLEKCNVLRPEQNLQLSSEIGLDETNIQREAFKQHKQILSTWKKNLNRRKQMFWNFYKCKEFVRIYNEWINLVNPVLPRKYLIREINGEQPEETKIRFELALHRFKTDIRLIEMKMHRYENSFKNIDSQMNEVIDNISTNETAEKLKEMWIIEVSREESKSLKIWEPKEQFLLNYSCSYGKEESVSSTQNNRQPRHLKQQRNRATLPRFERNIPNCKRTNKSTPSRDSNVTRTYKRIINTQPKLDQTSHSEPKNKLYSDIVKSDTRSHREVKNRESNPLLPAQNQPEREAPPQTQPTRKSQRLIHFLEKGQPKPAREKILTEETLVKTVG